LKPGGGGTGADPFTYIGGGGTGADPFRPGGGGTGADPFTYMGGGGTGAEPLKPGGGGTGAEPFAIRTPPSLCAAMTVLRLIAPARSSMARRRAGSLRDIESASKAEKHQGHSISNYTNVK
jgi:hypothetical protein